MTNTTTLDTARQLRQSGDAQGALRLMEEHLQKAPDDPIALKMRASTMLMVNPNQALNFALDYIRRQPQDPEGRDLAGQASSALGRHTDAVAAFGDAVRFGPDRPGFHCNYAIALVRANRAEEAETAAREALRLSPGYAPALNALGHALSAKGQPKEAIVAFKETLKQNLNEPDALTGIGRALRALDQPNAAILALRRAHRVSQSRVEPLIDLAPLYREACQGDEASATYRWLKSSFPPNDTVLSNALLDMLYAPDVSAENYTEAALAFGGTAIARVKNPAAPPMIRQQDKRPLRIGYLSADLRSHAASWLGAVGLIEHDPDRVETLFFDTSGQSDAITHRIRSAAATKDWIDMRGLDDDQAATRIAQTGLDILVDLSGHTQGNRMNVFARRAAPIQASWLGYPSTTGLPSIDYMIMDEAHAPLGSERYFSETLIRLDRPRFAYLPPDYAPLPQLTDDPITFGSFNNSSKLNLEMVKIWAEILMQVPDSRLRLKWRSYSDPILRQRISGWFAQYGIESDRLFFSPRSSHEEMLAEYNNVHIALDTFPFSGGVTTAEALFMGVPVVTRFDERTASRQGLCILSAIGRKDWARPDREGYVKKAVELAQDISKLRALRGTLRQEMMTSALGDGPGLARGLEDAYAEMLRGTRMVG